MVKLSQMKSGDIVNYKSAEGFRSGGRGKIVDLWISNGTCYANVKGPNKTVCITNADLGKAQSVEIKAAAQNIDSIICGFLNELESAMRFESLTKERKTAMGLQANTAREIRYAVKEYFS